MMSKEIYNQTRPGRAAISPLEEFHLFGDIRRLRWRQTAIGDDRFLTSKCVSD
jgi:hypothetical protein